MSELKIGDKVICVLSGVIGNITKIYKPTGAETQIMILTNNNRKYHAPYSSWRLVK